MQISYEMACNAHVHQLTVSPLNTDKMFTKIFSTQI